MVSVMLKLFMFLKWNDCKISTRDPSVEPAKSEEANVFLKLFEGFSFHRKCKLTLFREFIICLKHTQR